MRVRTMLVTLAAALVFLAAVPPAAAPQGACVPTTVYGATFFNAGQGGALEVCVLVLRIDTLERVAGAYTTSCGGGLGVPGEAPLSEGMLVQPYAPYGTPAAAGACCQVSPAQVDGCDTYP